MGWAIVIGHTERQFQTTNLLEVDSKPDFFKINILQVAMFQNDFMDPPKISKKKQNKSLYFFQCLLESLCPFKKIESLWVKAHYIVHKMLSQGIFWD